MHEQKNSKCVSPPRLAVVLAAALLLSGCGLFKTKTKVAVPQPLTPLVEADLPQMVEEINRLAAVRALNGKVDIQFLDNSFAECGIVAKNVLGLVFVVLGVIMAVPGVPGPGVLTVLLGVMMLDFPGKRDLEARFLGQPRVYSAVNALRARFGKPPLMLDEK